MVSLETLSARQTFGSKTAGFYHEREKIDVYSSPAEAFDLHNNQGHQLKFQRLQSSVVLNIAWIDH